MVVAVLLGPSAASGRRVAEQPGTVAHTWVVRWPSAGGRKLRLKRFATRGGLIRRVRVLIGRTAVGGPPYISIVRCEGGPATAQKAWLWDGRGVYVLLMLEPGRCRLAARRTAVRVVLTTVGT